MQTQQIAKYLPNSTISCSINDERGKRKDTRKEAPIHPEQIPAPIAPIFVIPLHMTWGYLSQ